MKTTKKKNKTGFKDHYGTAICEGDTLLDIDCSLEEDTKPEDITRQVYWCSQKGTWLLDSTYVQDQREGDYLWEELKEWRYKVFGNIYEGKAH